MNYLLDANTYIQAKNEYYHMAVCPGYWDWLDQQFATDNLTSVVPVYDELRSFGDELSAWVKARKPHFLEVSDEPTQNHYTEIAQYVAELPGLKPGAMEEFLDAADPWLIAKARDIEAVVVTHEVLVPADSKKIKIPNICRQFDVDYLNTFALLRNLRARFVLENGLPR